MEATSKCSSIFPLCRPFCGASSPPPFTYRSGFIVFAHDPRATIIQPLWRLAHYILLLHICRHAVGPQVEGRPQLRIAFHQGRLDCDDAGRGDGDCGGFGSAPPGNKYVWACSTLSVHFLLLYGLGLFLFDATNFDLARDYVMPVCVSV